MASKLYRITKFVDERRSAFTVSRLIMVTGVRLRQYGVDTPDEPDVVEKVMDALPSVLPPEDIAELKRLLDQG